MRPADATRRNQSPIVESHRSGKKDRRVETNGATSRERRTSPPPEACWRSPKMVRARRGTLLVPGLRWHDRWRSGIRFEYRRHRTAKNVTPLVAASRDTARQIATNSDTTYFVVESAILRVRISTDCRDCEAFSHRGHTRGGRADRLRESSGSGPGTARFYCGTEVSL